MVSPIRNVSWDEWEQITSRSKSTLSVAVEFSRTVDDELSPQSVVDDIFWQFRIGASSSEDERNSNNYINTYFQEMYHVCQLRGDNILKKKRYQVKKKIVRYISFHDQNFLHMIQNVKSGETPRNYELKKT